MVLTIARLLVVSLSLKRISALISGKEQTSGRPLDATTHADLLWVLNAAGKRLPMRIACYERGIAAYWMLQRRGFHARLHYGVGIVDEKLAAHVWVTSHNNGITGHEIAEQFREMMTF